MADFLDFTQFKRSAKPNNFLLAPKGLCQHSTPDMDSPVMELAPKAVFDQLVGLVNAEKLWTNLKTDRDGLRLSFVAVTPLLRFRDDVDIRVLEGDDAQQSRLAIYSRSRIGYSDLGKNASRVRDLVARLTVK